MSKQEHTSGPWEIYDGTNIMSNNRLVANTGGYTANVRTHEIRLENKANARLIKESPEMKKLLERLAIISDMAGWNDVQPLKSEAREILRRIEGGE